MTTDGPRLALTLTAVAVGWLALMLGAMFIPGAAPAALVIAPSARLLERLPDAVLVDSGRHTLTISNARTLDIYRAGAWLVLPAGLPLCVAPPDFAGLDSSV